MLQEDGQLIYLLRIIMVFTCRTMMGYLISIHWYRLKATANSITILPFTWYSKFQMPDETRQILKYYWKRKTKNAKRKWANTLFSTGKQYYTICYCIYMGKYCVGRVPKERGNEVTSPNTIGSHNHAITFLLYNLILAI